jgi:Glycosyl hydrolase catalytic core
MQSRSGPSTILAAILVILVCAASVHAARRTRLKASNIGIVAFDLNEPVPSKLAALGIGVVRGSCDWAGLEPAPRVFDWRCSDNVIVGAQRQGLRSYMTVTCAPAWASGTNDCGGLPRDMTDWYDFVQHFVARYRYYDVVLGVWNEPNLVLRNDPSGAIYAQMFINASNARNTVDPRFVLAGPEVSHHALAAGYYGRVMDLIQSWRALNPWDVVAVHWYGDGPPLPPFLDAVHASAERHDVWLSETGYSTADAGAQADFYRAMLDTFAASGRPWWTHLIFYRLWDGRDCCESILTGDYRAKPAFEAIQQWLESAPDAPNDRRPPR